MTTEISYGKLTKLRDVDQTIAEGDDDIRGRQVVDRNGLKLGKIDALLIDDKERKVRFLEVEIGGFLGLGERKSLIPVDAISAIDTDVVHIGHTRETVGAAPAYDPALADEPVWEDFYNYYGYEPYWGVQYTYAGLPHFKTSA
jgi:sporulation protein YlmC with PRC-barrel domain